MIAAEWLKIRSVRSTHHILVALALAVLAGVAVASAMVADWDTSPPADQAVFGTANVGILTIPFAQFCLAALGGLAVTAEYGSGSIQPSLVAVPRRLALLAGKAVVVAAGTLVVGQLVAFVSFAATWLIVGDRPPPIAPWQPGAAADGIAVTLSAGLSLVVAGLVGLGIGTAVRSTAGMLVTVTALLFVLPSVVEFLPGPWGDRLGAVSLTNLVVELAGTLPDAPLSPVGALAALAGYVLLALGAGAVVLTRRTG
ncbi:ABC-2 family transporter protein [Goodfellowiella coeruleoviolacea]|uniref:ABC-2 family transporter protein n=1 Tax=Goodfellowiella coeruleoviolacea TaxID=334858 RepID=A0AAE3GMV8_9PSEU|nr:ABC-2 family transporter protein [Goodfellowiella coeruleoviolacea]